MSQDHKITTEEVAQRVADGIALGGDWKQVFDRYVEAHNDRKHLLAENKKLREQLATELVYGPTSEATAEHHPECERRKGSDRCTCESGVKALAAELATVRERLHMNDRLCIESIAGGGIRVCHGYHHRSADCEWTEYFPGAPPQKD